MDTQLELQKSLNYIFSNRERFASKFYNRVFEKAPQARALFKKYTRPATFVYSHVRKYHILNEQTGISGTWT